MIAPVFHLQGDRKMAEIPPNDETEFLGDASHFVQEGRPDRVAVSIRRVLERHLEIKGGEAE